jgi:hypothetical protein
MHPVARVSIKYWKTSVRNTVFFSAAGWPKNIDNVTTKRTHKAIHNGNNFY